MSNRAKTAAAGVVIAPDDIQSSKELENRIAEARSKVTDWLSRVEAERQDRELRKSSDPNITAEVLAESRGRESTASQAAQDAQELVDALSGQLHGARDREWLSAKSRRKAELEARCAEADAIYAELDDFLTKAGQAAGRLKGLHLEVESFNRTSDTRVGRIQLPEHRIRNVKGYFWSGPVWNELERVTAVYPGAGRVEVPVITNLPIELPAPKPAATPSPQQASVASDPDSSIVMHVHRTTPVAKPPAEVGFVGDSLIRSGDEAAAAGARPVSDSRSIRRGAESSDPGGPFAAAGSLVRPSRSTSPGQPASQRGNLVHAAEDVRTVAEQQIRDAARSKSESRE